MNRWLAFGLVLVATPVAAQPITRPTACGATIAYAPDAVRATVEAELAREPTCNVTLEVRIVPTDGGLYLFARDEYGRVRERVVPDAQAAAVLVTSWMADDSRPLPPPRLPGLPRQVPPPTATVDPFDAPPVVAARRGSGPVLGAGPMLAGLGKGIRVELDVHSWGAWSAGAAVSFIDNEARVYTTLQSLPQPMDVIDNTLIAYVARHWDFGAWYLRIAAGAGATATRTDYEMTSDPYNPYGLEIHDSGIVATGEASALVGRRLGDRWQLDAGPGVTVFANGPGLLERTPQRSLFAALRYRL